MELNFILVRCDQAESTGFGEGLHERVLQKESWVAERTKVKSRTSRLLNTPGITSPCSRLSQTN